MEMTSATGAPRKAALYQPVRWPSIAYGVGMLAVYLGQRVLETGKGSTVCTWLGVLLALAATGARARRLMALPVEQRQTERPLLLLYVVGLVALGFYFLNSNLLWMLTGKTLEQRAPRLSTAIGTLWPALWLCAALPILFVELALQTMAKAPLIDLGRARAALLAGLGIALALIFAFSVSYVAAERDLKADFSLFRTARAGDATKKIVQALDKPVQIALFFPPANEVKEEVEGYFSDLTKLGKQLQVTNYDFAIHPSKARELGVSGNGTIVIGRDTLREQISMPLQLDPARPQLRTLDQEVNKRLMGVTRKQRIAYFTTGHDERGFEPANETDRRATLKQLKSLLTDQSYEPRSLGLAQGLGTDVPQDATIVLIVGPRKPFLPEETAALTRYLDRKGRILVALDPDAGVTMPELLSQLSLKYVPTTLANSQTYWRRSYQPSDRANIVSAAFSSHVSVSTIGRLRDRAPVIFVGAGSLEKDEKGAVGIVNVDFTVHAEPTTWADKNGDFEFQEGTETRSAFELAAAVNKRNASALLPEEEARAVVLADADCIADEVFRNVGNAYLALDAVKWLGGEERFTGQINNEEDVPIAHTRKQDTAWFYSTIFAAPLLVLGAGFVANRRRRPARRRAGTGAGTPPTVPPTPPASSTGARTEAQP